MQGEFRARVIITTGGNTGLFTAKLTLAIATGFLGLLLSGCGGDSSGGDTPQASGGNTSTSANPPREVSGSAVKGPLQNTDLNFYEFNRFGNFTTGVPVANTTTNSNGHFNVLLPAGTPNLLIGASGGGFFDESDPAGLRFISWPVSAELLGFMPSGQTTAAISVITDSLVRKSRLDAASGLTFNHSIAENRRQALRGYGFDPVSNPSPDPTNPPPGASEDEKQAAMVNGGFAYAVNTAALHVGLEEPNFEVLQAVLVDWGDCVLDGAFLGSPVLANGQQLPVNDFNHEIERFRNNFYDFYASTPLVQVNRVLCANKLPKAEDDSVSTNEDTLIEIPVLSNDSDPDGSLNPSSIEIIQQPAHGRVRALLSGEVRYVPNLNYFGPDSFRYRASDNLGARTNIVTVHIDVIDVNDLPVANNDAITILEDSGPVSINVLGNDTDVDGTIDPATLVITGGPSRGTAAINAGRIVYTPNPNTSGTDLITYRVRDDDGGLSNTGRLTIVIGAVNDPPVISNITDRTIPEDTSTGPVGFNVSDVDQSAGSLLVSAASSNTSLVPVGNIVFGGSGVNRTLTATPVAGAFGTTTITVTVRDASGRTASDSFVLTVTRVNDLPVANNDAGSVQQDGGPVVVNVVANDTDSDGSIDPATVVIVNAPLNGTATVDAAGNISYTPNAGFSGTDQIDYRVQDDEGASSNIATLTINVAANNPPTITSVSDQFINQDTSTSALPFMVDDVETADPNTLSVTANSSNTTLVPVANIVLGGSGNNRTVTITPAAGQFGTATITLTVSDGTDAAFTTFDVNVNDLPVVVDDFHATSDSIGIDIYLLDNDSDSNGLNPGSITITSFPTFGTVTLDSVNGVIHFDPDPIGCGECEDPPPFDDYTSTITYTVEDNLGAVSSTGTISVDVTNFGGSDLAVCHDNTSSTVCTDMGGTTLHGVDVPDCGDPFVNPCATIQYAINLAVPGNEVHVAADTFTHDYAGKQSPMVRMKDGVNVLGGHEPDCSDGCFFVQLSTPTTLIDTSTTGGTEDEPTRVVECSGSVGFETFMADFIITGSTGSEHSSAIVTNDSCDAGFGSTDSIGRFTSVFDGGAGVFTSAGILTKGSSSPYFAFAVIDGGSSPHPAGVKVTGSSSPLIVLNMIDGGTSSGSQATGVYLDTDVSSDVWHNWIHAGRGASTTIGLEQNGVHGNIIANNTIYGGDGTSSTYPVGLVGGAEPSIYNNILFNSSANSSHDCIGDFGGGNSPTVMNNDLFDCASTLPGSGGNVSLDPEFVVRSGPHVTGIDWHLLGSDSPCNVVEGGMDLSGLDPLPSLGGDSVDIDEEDRTSFTSCGATNTGAGGWSMGADEFDFGPP